MSGTSESTTRTWLIIAIVFCVFWFFYLALFGPTAPKPTLEGTGNGEPANFSWTFNDLDDRPVKLERFKGKTIFLNMWATWCPPCVREMPSIARLAEEPKLQGKDIAFVCVSSDERSEDVRRYLEGRSWKMQFFRAESLPRVFLTDGIPATFIIAPDGRIAAKQVGEAKWDAPETIALLEKLAAEAPKPDR